MYDGEMLPVPSAGASVAALRYAYHQLVHRV